MSSIIPSRNNIFFFWKGPIGDTRFTILKDSVYSTRFFNPSRPIYIVTDTLVSTQFQEKYNIQIISLDDILLEDFVVDRERIKKYKQSSARKFSNLCRLLLLYKFGGSYVDTDDLCINTLPSTNVHNIVCRSYDPHTCHYNQLTPDDCIPGKYREVSGYDSINIFPRNDCWLNFEPNSKFIYDILANEKFLHYDGVIYIGGGISWQSLALDTCKKYIDSIGVEFNLFLTLMYMYEDFVGWSSFYDRCMYGGEFCDLWKKLPNVDSYEWGKYKCDKNTALDFLEKAKKLFPHVSYMWLHNKDMNKEWMLLKLEETQKYSISSWILHDVREKIKEYAP